MFARNLKRFFIGRRGVSKGERVCFAKLNKRGDVTYDNCRPADDVDPADREEAAWWMSSNFGMSQDEWYERLWCFTIVPA